MKSRTMAAVLAITIFVIGIAGCRSDDTDFRTSPYYINYLSHGDKSVMEGVLRAAVRHKCLPQVMDDSNVTCTSVQNNIVVKVNLNGQTITIQPRSNKTGKNEYNEWVTAFGQEIKAQLGQ